MKKFGMFTDAGEAMMYDFVKFVAKHSISDGAIIKMLEVISADEMYAEASDTEVRECVFAELNRGAW